jgi:hypothetical protein
MNVHNEKRGNPGMWDTRNAQTTPSPIGLGMNKREEMR